MCLLRCLAWYLLGNLLFEWGGYLSHWKFVQLVSAQVLIFRMTERSERISNLWYSEITHHCPVIFPFFQLYCSNRFSLANSLDLGQIQGRPLWGSRTGQKRESRKLHPNRFTSVFFLPILTKKPGKAIELAQQLGAAAYRSFSSLTKEGLSEGKVF